MDTHQQKKEKPTTQAWARLVSLIADAAKRNDGVPQWRLECIFEIGDGSGRVWRSWASGSRVPYRSTQRFVADHAFKRGWLAPTDRELIELLALPNESIYSLPTAPVFLKDAPDPPDRLAAYERVGGANRASAALIRDAEFGIARERAKPDELSPGRNRAFTIAQAARSEDLRGYYNERCLLAARWKEAVATVNELLTTHDREIVQVALAVAYRKRGYP